MRRLAGRQGGAQERGALGSCPSRRGWCQERGEGGGSGREQQGWGCTMRSEPDGDGSCVRANPRGVGVGEVRRRRQQRGEPVGRGRSGVLRAVEHGFGRPGRAAVGPQASRKYAGARMLGRRAGVGRADRKGVTWEKVGTRWSRLGVARSWTFVACGSSRSIPAGCAQGRRSQKEGSRRRVGDVGE